MTNYLTSMKKELQKEAPAEWILSTLRTLYPGARITNRRNKNDRIDWRIYANIDDKNDLWLGETGNICIDHSTLNNIDKNLLQLFVNTRKLPGYHILIKNSKLDPIKIVERCEIVKRKTLSNEGSFETKAYIVPIDEIQDAVVSSYPSIAWWERRRL